MSFSEKIINIGSRSKADLKKNCEMVTLKKQNKLILFSEGVYKNLR